MKRMPTKLMIPLLIAAAGCSRETAPTAGAETSTPAATQVAVTAAPAPSAPVVRNYDAMELTPVVNRLLRGGRDFEQGRRLYDEIGCRLCHLFNGGAGGIGPDLSGVGGRFGPLDILRSILEPDADVSDLYGKVGVELADGRYLEGRMAPLDDERFGLTESISINPTTGTAFWGPATATIRYADVAWMGQADISPMPAGMINYLDEPQVADLIAYMITGGNPQHSMFRPLPEAPAATP
jgi:putative heme-binding domain-containing protein